MSSVHHALTQIVDVIHVQNKAPRYRGTAGEQERRDRAEMGQERDRIGWGGMGWGGQGTGRLPHSVGCNLRGC